MDNDKIRSIPELSERRGMIISKRPIVIITAVGQNILVNDTIGNVVDKLNTGRLSLEENKWVEFINPAGERVSLAPWIIDKIVAIYEVPGSQPCRACNGTGRT
jgi:hypothetical protein